MTSRFGFIFFLFYVTFNNQGHIAMGSLRSEEPVLVGEDSAL